MPTAGLHGKRVLVIDDDRELLALMEMVFGDVGAEVCTVASGAEGLGQILLNPPDLVILDIMMPGLDGWEVCSGIRRLSDVPIIFLTAKTGEGDMLRGFDLGAVDYVTKPFSIKVLLARAEAALRQGVGGHDSREVTGYNDGYLQVDLAGRLVRVNRQRVRLTQTEYRLLSVLVRNAGQVLSYEQILEHVWGWEYRDSPNYVHVYIRRLRQKLERDPGAPAYLLTERGVGYAFVRQTVY